MHTFRSRNWGTRRNARKRIGHVLPVTSRTEMNRKSAPYLRTTLRRGDLGTDLLRPRCKCAIVLHLRLHRRLSEFLVSESFEKALDQFAIHCFVNLYRLPSYVNPKICRKCLQIMPGALGSPVDLGLRILHDAANIFGGSCVQNLFFTVHFDIRVSSYCCDLGIELGAQLFYLRQPVRRVRTELLCVVYRTSDQS